MDVNTAGFSIVGMVLAYFMTSTMLSLYPTYYHPVLEKPTEDFLFWCTRGLYDPQTGHEAHKGLLSSILGYWSMAILSTALDLFLPASVGVRWKAQGQRSYFTLTQWFAAVAVSMGNLLLVAPLVTLPLYSWVRTACTPMSEADVFEWQAEAPKLLVCILFIDVWFYWTHRAIHAKALYKRIHKFHHRFHAPASVASMYANPLEFAVGNLMGVLLGPVVAHAHPYTAYFWITFSLINTGGSHSGWLFLGAQKHDWHHEFFNYEFGVLGVMDGLCGTGFEGSKEWKNWLAKRQPQKRSC